MSRLLKNIKKFNCDTILMFKELFNRKTYKKQLANILSFIRLLLVIPILILLIIYFNTNSSNLLIIIAILSLIGGITDFFDGRCARKFNSYSDYGKRIDQISDKTFASTLSLFLISINIYFIFVLILELLIIIINALFNLKFKDINNDSNFIGKLKQWPLFALLVVGFLSKINNIFDNITFILFILTVIMQLMTILSYINKHNNEIKIFIKNKIKGTKK